ncbi:MAG: single-stranded-DNA-specific exonuclease RecJ [Clostridia bacterium]|nr:single-stranded-DNA-specific exonuclease RecJ [Clostridia bacterium]
MQGKNWVFLNKSIKRESILAMSKQFGIPNVISTILLNRKIQTEAQVKAYLSKSMSTIHNPMQMKDMQKAVERIIAAIEKTEKIVVYGDYDVDGITATALLYMFFQELGANVDYYIPDRIEEGYGMNIMAVNKLAKSRTNLIITVDCGITAVGEVEFAKLRGVDIIITDHHTCKEKIPAAFAVINPKQPDCEYPFKDLSGVGVAFKLILALAMVLGKNTTEVFNKYSDIAAIGTVADVVPLLDENRVIVDKGLYALSSTHREGLKALLEISGLEGKLISAGSVAFGISPRLNAAGRLGTASTAVKLILSDDKDEAYKIAIELNEENRKRQLTEQAIFNDAVGMISSDPDFDKKKVIVLCKDGWHHGVIGIVASRITELFYKPCILITHENGICKGSGRSIPGFNLFDALNFCGELLANFGGHAVAAGLSLDFNDVDAFSSKINEYAASVLTPEDMLPHVSIDCLISPNDISLENAKLLSKLEPFGIGNPKPVFSIMGILVSTINQIGIDNKHIRLRLEAQNKYINAVGFHMGEYYGKFKAGDIVDIAFTMEINNFQGTENVQLLLKDIKKHQFT